MKAATQEKIEEASFTKPLKTDMMADKPTTPKITQSRAVSTAIIWSQQK